MRRKPKPNLTLENLDEDNARAVERLNALEAYKKHAEEYMAHVGKMIDDLQARLSALEVKLAKRR